MDITTIDWNSIFLPLGGGALIGLAASIFLLFNGKISGISGILGGAIGTKKQDLSWRMAFLLGLVVGGPLLLFITNYPFVNYEINVSWWRIVLGGLLVGLGTRIGSGCTSGHGVCGISRMSMRSLLATMTFIVFGILTVYILGQ